MIILHLNLIIMLNGHKFHCKNEKEFFEKLNIVADKINVRMNAQFCTTFYRNFVNYKNKTNRQKSSTKLRIIFIWISGKNIYFHRKKNRMPNFFRKVYTQFCTTFLY